MSNDTLQSILGSKTVSFYSIFAKALGSVQSAVMLSQAFFWQEKARFKSECIEIKGQMFFKKTAEEWYEETGLTQEQQSTARAKLSKCGVMLSELAGLPASLHYWVDMDAVVNMVEQYLKENKKVFVDKRTEKRDKKRSEKGKFEKTSNGKEPEHSIGNLPKQDNGIIPQQVDHNLPEQEAVKNGNIYNVESLESLGELKGEEPLSENGKAVITLHTPDQIENTFVEVVQQEIVSLDSPEHGKNYSGTRPGEIPTQPMTDAERDELRRFEQQSADEANAFYNSLKKETPASQDAGTLKAECFSNNPPPIFFNPELQRRYNGTAPTNGKARKTTPADRTAQICAELKTEEAVNFFHAIHAAWGEWIDYKRREKKGTYKTAKTEAATITALARTVNYDPEAGRAAIEHSIAHTYQGIYPPKDAAPAHILAARYSLEDHPIANTPEELRAELSRFYGVHKSEALLDKALRFAETNYGPERLKSIVTDFCGNRVAKGRHGETFGQHHAALGLWLKRQKGFDAKNDTGRQHANTQDQPQLRSAAPVKYSID